MIAFGSGDRAGEPLAAEWRRRIFGELHRFPPTVHKYLAAADRALALAGEPSSLLEQQGARPIARIRGAITFSGVSFLANHDLVLDGVSFDIAAGARVGIITGSGPGKITLIDLIGRFCDPTAGRILLDGIDLREYRLHDLRRQVAFVPQDAVLFSTTIAANIVCGRDGVDRDAIVAAAQAANAHEFIMRLPRGYDEPVGAGSLELSGGQRRCIALARAFLQDGPVLVLDEPLHGVDADSEPAIRAAVRRLMRGRTVILMTDDTRMLEGCEALFALERGRVTAGIRLRGDGRPAAPALAPGERCPNVRKHPAVHAWLQVNPAAEPHGITPLRVRRFKNKVYRLEGAGPAGTGVIAKRMRAADAAIERTVYEEILACVPVPSLQFYGSIDEPDGEHCWLFGEEAVGVDYSNLFQEHREGSARWLAQLHTGAEEAAAPHRLPDAGPARFRGLLSAAHQVLDEHVENPVLSTSDIIFLDGMRERLDDLAARWHRVEEICAGVPQTLVHGDFNGKNMRLRSSGGESTLLVFDWEDAGWGVPAVDLAQLAVPSGKLSANPDVATYWSIVRERWPERTADDWRRLADCGTVLRAVSALHWDALNLAHDWAHSYVGGMHVYAAEFDRALDRLGWSGR